MLVSASSRAIDPAIAQGGRMKRIFITGSTDGLGLAAARTLMAEGHEVVLHARNAKRAAAFADIAERAAGVVIGDLSNFDETRAIAEQVNRIGSITAVIHNAGIYPEQRSTTADGHAGVLAVNTLAPYILTALITRPQRLIYLSSSMHRSGADASLRDIDWVERQWDPTLAYSESKFYLTTLAFAVARRWQDALSNAVDPGWVPTRMGGPAATDDLTLGHLTQTWLAASDDPAAKVSGGYWRHRRQEKPAVETLDPNFQARLMAKLADLTGISLS